MTKKTNWNELFDIPTDVLKPLSVAYDSEEEVKKKTPYVMSDEVRILMDELTMHVLNTDVDSVINTLNASNLRINLMLDIANRMKKVIDDNKKNG